MADLYTSLSVDEKVTQKEYNVPTSADSNKNTTVYGLYGNRNRAEYICGQKLRNFRKMTLLDRLQI